MIRSQPTVKCLQFGANMFFERVNATFVKISTTHFNNTENSSVLHLTIFSNSGLNMFIKPNKFQMLTWAVSENMYELQIEGFCACHDNKSA